MKTWICLLFAISFIPQQLHALGFGGYDTEMLKQPKWQLHQAIHHCDKEQLEQAISNGAKMADTQALTTDPGALLLHNGTGTVGRGCQYFDFIKYLVNEKKYTVGEDLLLAAQEAQEFDHLPSSSSCKKNDCVSFIMGQFKKNATHEEKLTALKNTQYGCNKKLFDILYADQKKELSTYEKVLILTAEKYDLRYKVPFGECRKMTGILVEDIRVELEKCRSKNSRNCVSCGNSGAVPPVINLEGVLSK